MPKCGVVAMCQKRVERQQFSQLAIVMFVRYTCLHCLQARREQREERKRQRLEESQKESEDPAVLEVAERRVRDPKGTQLFPELPSAQQVH